METAVDNPTIFNGDKSKKPRQGSQMYIPVHRRPTGEDSSGEPSPRTPRTPRTTGSRDPKSSQDSYFEGNPEMSNSARRGRGRFRAPGNSGGSGSGGSSDSTGGDSQEHAPKGRDFDATLLRTYNDPSSRGKLKRGGRGRSGRRTGAGGEGKSGGRAGGEDGAEEAQEEEEYNEDSELTDSSVPGTPVAGGFPRVDVKAPGVAAAVEKNLIDFGDEAVTAQDTLDKLADAIKTMRMTPQNGSPVESPKEEWEDILNASDIDILPIRQAAFVGDEDGGDQEGPTPSSSKSFSKKKRRSSRIEAPIEVIAEPPSPDEPTVTLDCYDFPASFKTHHLHDIFREYENMRGGYRIKWLEDTRALIVFEHPAAAKKAYLDNVANPLAKIRPYNGPLPGKRSSSPPPRRPTTTDMVAKRLVHGALGVKVAKSPEQKIAEKQMLQAARDEREAKKSEAAKRAQDLDAAFNE